MCKEDFPSSSQMLKNEDIRLGDWCSVLGTNVDMECLDSQYSIIY